MNFTILRGKKLWAIVSITTLLAITLLGGLKIAGDAKSYLGALSGNKTQAENISTTSTLKADLTHLMNISQFPIVSQLLSLAGLNFSEIRNELGAGIDVAPAILNNPKPLRYLVSFQNSAEARGTGGILGAYAILEFNKGTIKVLQTGSNAVLYDFAPKKIPLAVTEEFLKLYGQNPAIVQNSNLSPHFPYGAEIWLALWNERFGEKLDGVIAIDPIALSYVLKATGEINLPTGEVITSENVVEETLKNVYKRYEKDNIARKQHLVDILNAAAEKIQAGQYSKLKMAQALRESIIQNRLLVYSTDAKVEKTLSKTRLGGFMSLDPNNEYRAVIQNIDAGKLDYYLDRKVSVKKLSCEKNGTTQVKVRVTNTLLTGKGLPAYVLTRADKGKPENLVPGSHRFKLFIYGPVGSRLVSVSRENRTANLGGSATERKRPIYVADVELPPGQSEELLANFIGGVGKITYVDQPLVRTTQIEISNKC